MKRFLSFLVAILMVSASISLTAYASDDFEFVASEDGTYYILSEYLGSSSVVDVPSCYDGLPVKVIGEAAFQHKEFVEKVILPTTITEIRTYAFAHCYELSEINIPASVVFLGSCAFSDCYGLSEIVIPNSVLSAELEVFRRCSGNIYCEAVSKPDGFSQYWTSTAANPPSVNWGYYKRGDLDLDGECGSLDYLFVRRACMNTYSLGKTEKLASDVNGDGEVNSADYLLIRRCAMGTYVIG